MIRLICAAILLSAMTMPVLAEDFVSVQVSPGTRICFPDGGTIRAAGATVTTDKDACVVLGKDAGSGFGTFYLGAGGTIAPVSGKPPH